MRRARLTGARGICVALAMFVAPMLAPLAAQGPAGRGTTLGAPATPADALVEAGRWAEAEDLYYEQSRRDPRDGGMRVALGRFLMTKGAVRAGIVLVEEGIRFGYVSSAANDLLVRWGNVLVWRSSGPPGSDSLLVTRPSSDADALFQVQVNRGGTNGVSVWYDVVPRMVGVDSASSSPALLGIETMEHLVPSFDAAARRLVLSADARSALRAEGTRYQLLRDERGVRVLMAPGDVRPLASALRELRPSWWQLDLPHGLLVVRP